MAFRIYRDTPPTERSLRKTARALVGDGATARRLASQQRQVNRWSSKYRWVARVDAWDRYRERVALETELDEIRKMRREHITLARTMQSIAARSIQRLQQRMNDDPQATLRPNEIRRWIVESANLQRLTYEMPTSRTEHELRPARSWTDYLASLRSSRGLPDRPWPDQNIEDAETSDADDGGD